MNTKTKVNFLKNKTPVIGVSIAIIASYLLFDFGFLNTAVHGAMKIGATFILAPVFRNLFFRQFVAGYVENGGLLEDLANPSRTGADERLKVYRMATIISFAVVAFLLGFSI